MRDTDLGEQPRVSLSSEHTLDSFKKSLDICLSEYLVGFDLLEAIRSIVELQVSERHASAHPYFTRVQRAHSSHTWARPADRDAHCRPSLMLYAALQCAAVFFAGTAVPCTGENTLCMDARTTSNSCGDPTFCLCYG